jgi:hypothetical protein
VCGCCGVGMATLRGNLTRVAKGRVQNSAHTQHGRAQNTGDVLYIDSLRGQPAGRKSS